jgi:hypothetical protein
MPHDHRVRSRPRQPGIGDQCEEPLLELRAGDVGVVGGEGVERPAQRVGAAAVGAGELLIE